jgi:hypothetical protein
MLVLCRDMQRPRPRWLWANGAPPSHRMSPSNSIHSRARGPTGPLNINPRNQRLRFTHRQPAAQVNPGIEHVSSCYLLSLPAVGAAAAATAAEKTCQASVAKPHARSPIVTSNTSRGRSKFVVTAVTNIIASPMCTFFFGSDSGKWATVPHSETRPILTFLSPNQARYQGF